MQTVIKPRFPILKLPDVVFRLFLTILGITERICYSLCSKRCSFRTKRLKIEVETFLVRVGSNVEISFVKFNPDIIEIILLPEDNPDNDTFLERIPVPLPIAIRFKFYNETLKTHYLQKMASLKEILLYFEEMFSFKEGLIAPKNGCERFHFDSLKKQLEGCNLKQLNMSCYYKKIYGRELLDVFLPWSMLKLLRYPYDTDKQFREGVLEHKLDALYVCSSCLDFYRLIFDMDIKHIEFSEPVHLERSLNEFIKKWINGETNVNLESLCIKFRRDTLFGNYQQEILDGIGYQLVTTVEPFMPPFTTLAWKYTTSIIGMYEVRRKIDGKRATIRLDQLCGNVRFKFIVWQ